MSQGAHEYRGYGIGRAQRHAAAFDRFKDLLATITGTPKQERAGGVGVPPDRGGSLAPPPSLQTCARPLTKSKLILRGQEALNPKDFPVEEFQ